MTGSPGDVRIHTGPQAAEACEDINARAFTVGNHVAFNTGEFDPSSAEGQHILAHELAHVRQQTGGAVSMLPQPGALEIDPDERLEREAEKTAQQVMEGGELGIQRMSDSEVHIQRAVQGEDPYGQAHDEFIEKQKERLYGDSAAAAGVEVGALLDAFKGGGIEGVLGAHLSQALVDVLANLPIPDPMTTLASAFVAGGTVAAYTTLTKKLDGDDVREAFAAAGLENVFEKLWGSSDSETDEGINADNYS